MKKMILIILIFNSIICFSQINKELLNDSLLINTSDFNFCMQPYNNQINSFLYASKDCSRNWLIKKSDDGYFYLFNSLTDLYLTASSDSNVNMSKSINSDNQKWKILYASGKDLDFYIVSKSNNLYLTLKGGQIYLSEFEQNNNFQIWFIGEGFACPFVYLFSNNEYNKIGEILKNQISISNNKLDSLEIFEGKIMSDTLKIKIKEEKFETSYIDITYIVINNILVKPMNNENKILELDCKYLELNTNDYIELEFNISNFKNQKVNIILYAKGYYEIDLSDNN